MVGIAFVTIAIISACGLSGLNVGFIGLYFAKFLRYMFGIGAWFTTLLIALVGAQYIMKHRGLTLSTRFFGLLLLYFSCLAVYHHFVIPSGEEILPASLPAGGGLIGGGVLFFVRKFFGVDGGIIVLGAGIIGSVLLSTTWSLASGMLKTKQGAENGLIVAKDTIETTYGKMVEVEGKVKDKVKGSFYNQEQDGHFSEDMAAETETKTSLPEEAVEQHRAADEPFTKPAIETEALPAMEKPVEQLPLLLQLNTARIKSCQHLRQTGLCLSAQPSLKKLLRCSRRRMILRLLQLKQKLTRNRLLLMNCPRYKISYLSMLRKKIRVWNVKSQTMPGLWRKP